MSEIKRLRLADCHPEFGSNKVFDAFQYSPAVTAGGLAFISGQIGLNSDGTVPESPRVQAERAFARLAAILNDLGIGFTHLVDLVTYHTDVTGDLADFRAVKEKYIPSEFPAWTIIGVSSLARKELVVEIKAVAAVTK